MKQRVRGATDIINKADVVLGLERQGHKVTLSAIKARTVNRVEMTLVQDPHTLLLKEVRERADHIEALWIEGKTRPEIINLVVEQYGGIKDTIGKAVDRARKKLLDECKLGPPLDDLT